MSLENEQNMPAGNFSDIPCIDEQPHELACRTIEGEFEELVTVAALNLEQAPAEGELCPHGELICTKCGKKLDDQTTERPIPFNPEELAKEIEVNFQIFEADVPGNFSPPATPADIEKPTE